MKKDKINKILIDLFNNKLNLENNLKEYLKQIYHPFDSFEDYRKYGDMFIELRLNDNEK